jgi:hypothetical protein
MKSWSFAGFVGGVLLVSTLFACPAYAQQNNNGNAFGNALEAGLNAQRRKSLVEMETASRISEIEGLYKSKDQTTPRIRGLREEYKQRLLVGLWILSRCCQFSVPLAPPPGTLVVVTLHQDEESLDEVVFNLGMHAAGATH